MVTALVLAADRTPSDPVKITAGVACKAFAPVAGIPMVLRVLDALERSGMVKDIVLAGPPADLLSHCPELVQRIEGGSVRWLPNLDSPSLSAEAAIETVSNSTPVLLTTADHALLTPDIVRSFVSSSLQTRADATVGLVDYERVAAAFPGVRRTVTRLRDGGFCGCNLYMLLTSAGRTLVPYWKNVEQSRKRPARLIAGLLGPAALIAYVSRRLTMEGALAAISGKLRLTVKPVVLPFANAGVDVDNADDLQLADRVLRGSPL